MGDRRPPIATVGALSMIALGWFDSDSELASDARRALESATFTENADVGPAAEALAEPPALDDVYSVGTNRDDDPIYVPVVEADLGTVEDPDLDAAYEVAATVVAALRPVLADEHVRQYDVVFAYGDRSWFDATDRGRIAVTPALAERLDREPSFEATDLRRAIEEADDGDDVVPPVGWGEPLPHSYYHGSDGTAVAATGGAFF